MITVLDIGNRRIKWGRQSAQALAAGGAEPWRERPLDALFEQVFTPAPQRVLVSSVASGDLEAALEAWCRRHLSLAPEYLRSSAQAGGVRSGYANPSQLGDDRWAALLGLHALGRGDACVVDCGTAVTIDVLDASGRHLGGAITAGLATMRQALGRDTHRLRDEPATPALLADNTSSGIQGGTLVALAGAVERLIEEAERLSGLRLHCVLTGGDAEAVRGLLRREVEWQPHLVLHGVLVGLHG